MAKKTKRAKYTSKGERSNVARDVLNAVRRERSPVDIMLNKLKAWSRGKRVMVTVPNPNPHETNKKFIRVESNDPKAFGPYRRADKPMKVIGATDD